MEEDIENLRKNCGLTLLLFSVLAIVLGSCMFLYDLLGHIFSCL